MPATKFDTDFLQFGNFFASFPQEKLSFLKPRDITFPHPAAGLCKPVFMFSTRRAENAKKQNTC